MSISILGIKRGAVFSSRYYQSFGIMQARDKVNKTLTALLSIIFAYTLISSLAKFYKDEIGNRLYVDHDQFPSEIPSLIICPWSYNPLSNVAMIASKDNFSLENMESLPRVKDSVTVEITIKASYSE